jgi:hypothetical protein
LRGMQLEYYESHKVGGGGGIRMLGGLKNASTIRSPDKRGGWK